VFIASKAGLSSLSVTHTTSWPSRPPIALRARTVTQMTPMPAGGQCLWEFSYQIHMVNWARWQPWSSLLSHVNLLEYAVVLFKLGRGWQLSVIFYLKPTVNEMDLVCLRGVKRKPSHHASVKLTKWAQWSVFLNYSPVLPLGDISNNFALEQYKVFFCAACDTFRKASHSFLASLGGRYSCQETQALGSLGPCS
jgi:hypothetical protein